MILKYEARHGNCSGTVIKYDRDQIERIAKKGKESFSVKVSKAYALMQWCHHFSYSNIVRLTPLIQTMSILFHQIILYFRHICMNAEPCNLDLAHESRSILNPSDEPIFCLASCSNIFRLASLPVKSNEQISRFIALPSRGQNCNLVTRCAGKICR